jgi:hypothetical protein
MPGRYHRLRQAWRLGRPLAVQAWVLRAWALLPLAPLAALL